MSRRISVEEARESLDDLLDRVSSGNGAVIVEKKGKPLAVLITPKQWEHYQQLAKDRFFEIVDTIHARNTDKDPEEVYRDVTAAVEEVRQEMYEREQKQAPRRS